MRMTRWFGTHVQLCLWGPQRKRRKEKKKKKKKKKEGWREDISNSIIED